jgi:diguanylate cyclase (GGDEF)-like protein
MVAKLINESLRSQDLVSRWGGEEFLVLLPQSSVNEALQVAERVRHAVGFHTSQATTGMAGVITVSAGVTELRPDDDDTTAISRADFAMYRGKTGGQNQVNSY